MPESYVIKMPQLSDTMTEGVVVSWEKQPGDKIERGDVVATVETDKAIMDVVVFRAGWLSGPLAAIDSTIEVGGSMGYVVEQQQEVSAEGPPKTASERSKEGSKETRTPSPEFREIPPSPPFPKGGETSSPPLKKGNETSSPPLLKGGAGGISAPRPGGKRITPYARKLAAQMRVALDRLSGSGPGGAITAADVSRAPVGEPPAGRPTPQPTSAPGEGRAMSQMERAMSQNMTAALTLPTFNMTAYAQPEALKRTAKTQGVSFTVAIAKACAAAIQKQPNINWCYQPGDRIVERAQIDIGLAVATEDGGLVVPVLRGCESRELDDLNNEWRDLLERARKRRLSAVEYSGSTFQISNLGMFGVSQFNALPTPGLGAILAIATAGSHGLPLTITCDHRVITGAQAAQFLQYLKEAIERPETWLKTPGPAIPEGEWDYQVAVIGAGPGGEDCARELAQRGVKVVLINDMAFPGGECLWRGCIPSKTWRAAADRIRDRARDARLGVEDTANAKLNWRQLEKTRRELVESRGRMALDTDKAVKIDLIEGRARFESDHRLAVAPIGNGAPPGGAVTVSFGAAVIATGAPPYVPPITGAREGVEAGGVLTSDTIWGLKAPPKRLVIVGCGAIGVEMAQIFADFGAEVSLLEAQPRILAEVDAEIAGQLQRLLEAEPRIDVQLNAKVGKIAGNPGRMTIAYTDAEDKSHHLTADYVLMATGKRPRLEPLHLDAAEVLMKDGMIEIDAAGRTSASHIYAVGDVAGGLMLAHTAAHQGRIAAAKLLGETRRYDPAVDCGVIFTRPQAAFAGLTAEQAKARGIDAMEIKTPIRIDAKAMIEGETEGLIKLVADRRTQRIVGAHLLADHADTLIGEAVMMVSGGLTLEQVAEAIHPHPTQTELFGDLARRLLARQRRSKEKTKV